MLNINNAVWNEVTADDVKNQIEKTEVGENFFFEFKSSRESSSKMMKEISAFSNTFGGYIFIGVENDKSITGRGDWTEERLLTSIHDSITPTPIFDVKEFVIDNQPILVVRIEEGTMPPYIVNDGRIYERVSSGSFPIKDSAKLNQLSMKHKENDINVSQIIEIDPIDKQSKWHPQNICAYIDVGFAIVCRDKMRILPKQNTDGILKKVASVISQTTNRFNISIVGTRIVITLFHLNAYDQQENEAPLDSGIQNFIEILNDGSVRFRIIISNTEAELKANITIVGILMYIFREIYSTIIGPDFDKQIVYARKYEKLTVLRQFIPFYSDITDFDMPLSAFEQFEEAYKAYYGVNQIIIGNRVPPSGFLLIDQQLFNEFGMEWNTDNIIKMLLSTIYTNLGFVEKPILWKK